MGKILDLGKFLQVHPAGRLSTVHGKYAENVQKVIKNERIDMPWIRNLPISRVSTQVVFWSFCTSHLVVCSFLRTSGRFDACCLLWFRYFTLHAAERRRCSTLVFTKIYVFPDSHFSSLASARSSKCSLLAFLVARCARSSKCVYFW